jgi:hypothetical protein
MWHRPLHRCRPAVRGARATAVQASNDWWQQHDQRVYACIKLWVEQWWESQRRVLIDAVGEVFGQERHNRREAIAKIKERVIQLEATDSLEARFAELAHEVKGQSQIPQGELQEKFEALQRRVDELKSVADLDARFRGLTERVCDLEKANNLEARFTELAHEVKRGSEMIPQTELLAKMEGLQRQLDDPKRIADLDARFRELAERVSELEKTNTPDARFAELAHEVKRGSETSQAELLAKVEGLQRQIDDQKRSLIWMRVFAGSPSVLVNSRK